MGCLVELQPYGSGASGLRSAAIEKMLRFFGAIYCQRALACYQRCRDITHQRQAGRSAQHRSGSTRNFEFISVFVKRAVIIFDDFETGFFEVHIIRKKITLETVQADCSGLLNNQFKILIFILPRVKINIENSLKQCVVICFKKW